MRPLSTDDYVGQEHLVGPQGILTRMIKSGHLSSFILWGPPGVGKTTLAQIMARHFQVPMYQLSAVTSGVKEVREVIEKAKNNKFFDQASPILFIDEIHRFSKSQQDSLLGAVEQGTFTLIGATTENPSFEIITPLLSRCQTYTLKPLQEADLQALIQRAVTQDPILSRIHIQVKETRALIALSGGDARKLLNLLELAVQSSGTQDIIISDELVTSCAQHQSLHYDKDGEMHYDIVSAFIKSIRGSDPDAALYWMARMIQGGEKPEFIARRIVISAAEDIGLANPNALLLANATFDIIHKIGWPEARIPLAQAVIYLASSPKSNSAYKAINLALQEAERHGDLPVPLHLRNAPTKLMQDMGYGAEYLYPHDYKHNFITQQYLPDEIRDLKLWQPQDNPSEEKARQYLNNQWKNKYEKQN